MEELNTMMIDIPVSEYKKLLRKEGRMMALVELIEAQEPWETTVHVNDVLRMLGYSELACDREIARKKALEETRQIEVIS